MEYVQISFPVTGTVREILIAELSEAGCEGFEETEEQLLASMPAPQYNEEIIASLAAKTGVRFSTVIIPQQNWNAIWEAGFEPVIVPGFCTVRAAFHAAATDTPYEIIITPKMSFGTGHHATTRLMMAAMKDIDFKDHRVLDFGTGTGILAILADKLGAESILAIDNDEWSVENALENANANFAGKVVVCHGSLEVAGEARPYDVIIANINRNILLQYMAQMKSMLAPDAVLLLSGILTADEHIITESALEAGLTETSVYKEEDWIAIKFTAQSLPFLAI